MVHIYTFCDKTLIGRCENISAKFLCENLYKMNFKIEKVCVYSNKYDYQSLNFKNKDIYFILMQKTSNTLNSYIASLNGAQTEENIILKNAVSQYYSSNNLPQDANASLEWLIPKGAMAITNPNGKTQGYMAKIGEAEIFVLPNNFIEFKNIYFNCVLNYLEKNYKLEYKSETYKTFGLNEDHLKTILQDLIKNKDGVTISVFSNGLDNNIVLKAKESNEKFEEYRRSVFTKLEKYIYSVQDLSLLDVFLNELSFQNIKLSFVGNLPLAYFLNVLPESSKQFIAESFIVTTPLSISNFIGKSCNNITNEIIYDTAVKLLEKSKANLSVVIFAEAEDSVTKTYIALGNKIKIDIYKNQFSGNIDENKNNIINAVLFYLIKRLKLRDLKTL